MDVRERIEPGAARRCPYCHDLLEGEQPDDALVVCGACGTRHHAACVDELGRCTVLGCGWSAPDAVSLPHMEDARTLEELRRVIHARVRRYLAGRTSPRRPDPDRREGRSVAWSLLALAAFAAPVIVFAAFFLLAQRGA